MLLGLSFPPFPFAPLAWVALVPLLLRWDRTSSGRDAFLDACIAFWTAFALAFHWPLFHVFAETAWLSLPGLIVVPMWMALPFGLSAAFRRRLGPIAGLLALVTMYLVMEFGLSRGPLAFPWTLLGHSQAELFPLNRLAALGGVPALTFLVLALNVLCHRVVRITASRTGRVHFAPAVLPPIAAALICTAANLPASTAPGASVLNASNSTASDGTNPPPTAQLRIGVVQPAVSAERWADLQDRGRVADLLRLTENLARRSDSLHLIVWPETALPSRHAGDRVQDWVEVSRIPVLAGAILAAGEDGVYHNTAMLFRPDAAVQIYRKVRLVPFAEYVPFQDRWPWMKRLAIPAGGVRSYARGKNDHLLQIKHARLGVQICFETLFSDQARTYASAGADLIVAITQDGWWGDSFGHRQHLAFGRLRAIESGLPMVQASVSGISAVIAPDGRLVERVGWMERDSFAVEIPNRSRSSVYVRYGDLVTPAALVITMGLGLLLIIRSRQ